MITCPECGQAAPDDAKFCDRCGQGLAKSVAPKVEYALAALEPGAVVRGEFRIVEVLGRSAQENRYRAERTRNGRAPERVQLRERFGPAPAESHREEQASAAGDGASTHEDPAGPHAKTADLKHPAETPPAQSAGDSAALAGSNGASVGAAERGAAARRRRGEYRRGQCEREQPEREQRGRAGARRRSRRGRDRTAFPRRSSRVPRTRAGPATRALDCPASHSRARARAPRVRRVKTRQTRRTPRTWAICSGACLRFR